MTSLSRTDSLGGGPFTPTMSSKSLNGMLLSNGRRTGPPRIDMEPIYTALKSAIGDNYGLYRDSISLYMMGRLNQEELSLRIDPFIYANATTTHLHNQFIAGIYSNSHRDPPDSEIAPYVSSTDKPSQSTSGKPISGDAAEQRLKAEIMALPPRERHRLKQLAERGETTDDFARIMRSIKDREAIRPPDVVPASSGGFNKTNWELEIGKQFEVPLFSESNEFPDADQIQKRLVPLCYQEGLAGGAGPNCSDLVNVAAEMFIKQLLADVFRRTRSNGANYIQTAKFRRRLAKEETQLAHGSIKRDGFGLLPCEHEVERQRTPFGVEDLRFSLQVGGNYLAQNKMLAAKIFTRPMQRQENRELEMRSSKAHARAMVNGINGHAHTNGIANGGPVVKMERTSLDDTLDEIMDF